MGWYDLRDDEEEMVVGYLANLFLLEEEEMDPLPLGAIFTASNGQTLIKVSASDYRPYYFY